MIPSRCKWFAAIAVGLLVLGTHAPCAAAASEEAAPPETAVPVATSATANRADESAGPTAAPRQPLWTDPAFHGSNAAPVIGSGVRPQQGLILSQQTVSHPHQAGHPQLKMPDAVWSSKGGVAIPPSNDWGWHVLPSSTLYKAYLAGVKESRMSGRLISEANDGWLFDGNLGGRAPIIRWGNRDPINPQGWQFDVEGSAHVRLDLEEELDVRSVDFRAGGLLARAYGRHQTKLAYYHISSHVGDEFLLKTLAQNPNFERINFVRDVLVLGHSINIDDCWRVYGEIGYAFHSKVADQWEMQFGLEYAPRLPTGIHGAPFAAVNGYLREELEYGGDFSAQAGWAWRSDENGRLFRIGVAYYNGQSSQWSFFNQHENSIGLGVWYDY